MRRVANCYTPFTLLTLLTLLVLSEQRLLILDQPKSGLLTKLKMDDEKMPWLVGIHCLNHRLELVLHKQHLLICVYYCCQTYIRFLSEVQKG